MTTCKHHHHHHEDAHNPIIRRRDLLASGAAGLATGAMASTGLGIPDARAAGLAAYADPDADFDSLAKEQAEFRAGQIATKSDEYYAAIQSQVTNNWLRPPTARPGLRCRLKIVQIPGGEVISAAIAGKCNADEATRRSLVAAVDRAGSLPYRGFEEVFQREIDFIFTYDDD